MDMGRDDTDTDIFDNIAFMIYCFIAFYLTLIGLWIV